MLTAKRTLVAEGRVRIWPQRGIAGGTGEGDRILIVVGWLCDSMNVLKILRSTHPHMDTHT